jgi:hypothetical protein
MCFFSVNVLYVQGCCLARVFLPEVEYHNEIHVFPTRLFSLLHSPPWSSCSVARDWALWLYFQLISSNIYGRKAESRTVLQKTIFEGCYLPRYGALYFGRCVPGFIDALEWGHCLASKRRNPIAQWCGVMSQENVIIFGYTTASTLQRTVLIHVNCRSWWPLTCVTDVSFTMAIYVPCEKYTVIGSCF